jgi:hypothetical protein
VASNSDPHATDMGGMEPEPAFVHDSSNPLQPLLGFRSRHYGPSS